MKWIHIRTEVVDRSIITAVVIHGILCEFGKHAELMDIDINIIEGYPIGAN